MDTNKNVENKMADGEDVQKVPEVIVEAVSEATENGNAAETVVTDEAKTPENSSETPKELTEPGQEVPVVEVSVLEPEAGDDSPTIIVPADDTAIDSTVTAGSSSVNVEVTDEESTVDGVKPDENTTEATADSEETKQTDEDEPVNIENNAEPEKELGPLMETNAEPLSREGTPPVIIETPPVPQIEVPDATQTPPPIMIDGEEIDENAPQIINVLSPYIDDNASIASSIEVPVYNRAELVEKYQQSVEERSNLQTLNSQLQHKLAEYFRKKKTDEKQQEVEKNSSDQEQRYIKYLANLDELQTELFSEQESYKEQIEELKERCYEKQDRVQEARGEFMKHKYSVAKQALNSRSGRSIPLKDIEQYQQQELKKDHEVMLVRLENIKLKNRLKKREMQLKAKEELAEGLHLIDFEQLKIENQTYNEKIEERNEELLKLRKKITTTVQVLTHLKEKLQFVQAENAEQRSSLKIVEVNVAQKRDKLTRTKQARDALRIDNVKLRQKCGLLGNEPLLRDYEERKDESSILGEKIEYLKLKHAELTMNSAGVKKKIDETQQQLA